MKQGNQFYLEFFVSDENDIPYDINMIKKAQFNIENLTKTYDGVSNEVEYDKNQKKFKVWLNEKETFGFDLVNIDVRLLFTNDNIIGSDVVRIRFKESVNEVLLDDKNSD